MKAKGETIQVANFPLPVEPVDKETNLDADKKVYSLTVKASKNNAGTIYLGHSAGIVYPLSPSETVTINLVKPNEVWVMGDTVGDKYFVIFGDEIKVML
jgi:hypothetical protein